MTWWFFDGWRFLGGWQRIYSRGPMRLTYSQAEAEYLDTREALPELVRAFQWDGARWMLVWS